MPAITIPAIAPGRTIIITATDPVTNPVDAIGGAPIIPTGGDPGPTYIFSAPFETINFKFSIDLGAWIAYQ